MELSLKTLFATLDPAMPEGGYFWNFQFYGKFVEIFEIKKKYPAALQRDKRYGNWN